MSAIVIGVDGGGSKTHVIVTDETGAEITSVEGAGSAIRPGEAERSAAVIAPLVADALASAAMTHVVPRVLCVGVAGAGADSARQALWQALASRELAEDVVVHTDARIAMASRSRSSLTASSLTVVRSSCAARAKRKRH